MEERRIRGREQDRYEETSSSDGEHEPEVIVEERRYRGRLLSDSESEVDQSDGEITESSDSDSDFRHRESSPDSEDDHHHRFHEHDHHNRRRRRREGDQFDNLPIPGDDQWFEGDVTIEEIQREEIRNLKRKLEDSRREIQQRDEDIEELKRSKRDDDYEMGRLKDSVYNKKQDIINLRYKYDKAQDSKKWLKEEHDHLSDMVQQYYSSKEDETRRRRRTEDDLAHAKYMNKTLRASIKEVADREKYMETVQKERTRADNYRKMMTTMMQQMNEDNRGADGAAPSWKNCEICILEYNQTAPRIPRVLNCGHTLCHSCADQLVEDDEVQCPFDRSFTYLEEGSVSGLPKNYSVLQM